MPELSGCRVKGVDEFLGVLGFVILSKYFLNHEEIHAIIQDDVQDNQLTSQFEKSSASIMMIPYQQQSPLVLYE